MAEITAIKYLLCGQILLIYIFFPLPSFDCSTNKFDSKLLLNSVIICPMMTPDSTINTDG